MTAGDVLELVLLALIVLEAVGLIAVGSAARFSRRHRSEWARRQGIVWDGRPTEARKNRTGRL